MLGSKLMTSVTTSRVTMTEKPYPEDIVMAAFLTVVTVMSIGVWIFVLITAPKQVIGCTVVFVFMWKKIYPFILKKLQEN